jgi:lipopolysaccharide transport system ATP-binding protein
MSSNSPAIVIEHLTRQYQLGLAAQDTMLRERLVNWARLSFLRQPKKVDTLWALRDVSLTVERGEVLGIIGRNGAGKSTLLKVLSRITYPTSGRIQVNGRVASLLEVGTGFHEELTGRENIFLNGSILGMSRRDVLKRMDAIVDFSGVERFLDTPIKRYSSGMRLRLGFAVAAHLDPDVLIVDEVLAVGDAAFQKKCLNTMAEMHGGGRTVLFVSHNLAAVENLCSRCVWLDQGQVKRDGESRAVIEEYMGTVSGHQTLASDLGSITTRRGDGAARFTRAEFLTPDHEPLPVIRAGEPLVIRMHYDAKRPVHYPSFGARIHTEMGTLITETSTWHHGIDFALIDSGPGYVDLEIACLSLLPGRYHLSLWLSGIGGVLHDGVEQGLPLDIESGTIYGSARTIDSRFGIVFFPQKWSLEGVRMAAECTER